MYSQIHTHTRARAHTQTETERNTYIEGADQRFGKSGAVPYVFSTQEAFADVSFIMPLTCFLDPRMQALLAALPDERDGSTAARRRHLPSPGARGAANVVGDREQQVLRLRRRGVSAT